MNGSRIQILLVAALLALLALLAGLQYQWLGKISEGERERLQKHLQTDTERFVEDFNREIQNTYFTFQLPDAVWREKNWAQFAERFDYWRSKTAYPTLITDFYFVENRENSPSLRYNFDKKVFETIQLPDELKTLQSNLTDEKKFSPIVEKIPALVMPIHKEAETFNRVWIRTENLPPKTVELPKKFGFLVIKLDENVIKNQILPDLVRKYFSDGENSNYKLVVTEEGEQPKVVFGAQTDNPNFSDASAKLFSLSPENFAFFVNKDVLSTINGENKNYVISQKFETKETVNRAASDKEENIIKAQESDETKPRVRIFESQNSNSLQGVWTLKVTHSDGSLEQFINNTRYKNLAVSFGILSLLAVSIILIFLSAQRAKRLAQKQIDFVSAVSHEFRTPLAVIYSAGENLTDGVVQNENQIYKYGNLIKREGKKLSQMVEQILEFAGARSGRRKYDLREVIVKDVVENALSECQPLIEEKKFTIEKNIAENLPKVSADANALSHSIQNLINNSIKYSNGKKWIKISANNGGGTVKIIVEDKGIGISSKEISHIFEPFYRSKRVVDEQIHGNGLGLSLVKQTIEAHGGKISAESRVNDGSRFTIILPAKIKTG